jgi:hypothetical protein
MKQQYSHDNPGWKGPGIPTVRTHLVSTGKKIASLLIHDFHLREAIHIFQGFVHDFYFFHVNNKPGRVECPCCGWSGPSFLSNANWRAVTFNSRCPCCDSRSRHRGLAVLLPNLLENLPGIELLYFAPEKILLDKIQPLHLKTFTSDLNSVDVDYPGEDIQHLSFAAEEFSAIICNHVLEHLPNDRQAIAECSRILKPKGVAIFTIPGDFPGQATCEYKTPDSNGHYRHYGMDVLEKFGVFFDVQAVNMHQGADEKFKVRPYDYVFVCVRKEFSS